MACVALPRCIVTLQLRFCFSDTAWDGEPGNINIGCHGFHPVPLCNGATMQMHVRR